MAKPSYEFLAVSERDFHLYGCPHCGYDTGAICIQDGTSAGVNCRNPECRRNFAVVQDGVAKSTTGSNGGYPDVLPHPRRDIPSHGRVERPESGNGEFFVPRGVGNPKYGVMCFVCNNRASYDLAGFVRSEAAGKRVVEMFTQGAELEYFVEGPCHTQVVIGACTDHLANLRKLEGIVQIGMLTASDIDVARIG